MCGGGGAITRHGPEAAPERIGYLSFELQLRYRRSVTVMEAILSGFFDSIGLYRQPDHRQQLLAARWLACHTTRCNRSRSSCLPSSTMTSPAVSFWVGRGLKIISPLRGLMATTITP